jgi:hypothetical protein
MDRHEWLEKRQDYVITLHFPEQDIHLTLAECFNEKEVQKIASLIWENRVPGISADIIGGEKSWRYGGRGSWYREE